MLVKLRSNSAYKLLIGIENWCSRFGKLWQFLIKLNIHSSPNRVILFLGIYPKETKTYVHTKICMQIFRADLLIITHTKKKTKKTGNNPKDHQLVMGKQTVAYPYNGILLSKRKIHITVTYSHMEESQKHCAK